MTTKNINLLLEIFFCKSRMNSASAIPFSKQKNLSRIVWFWQSSSNLWIHYSDFESEYIEEAHQQKEIEIKLNDSLINLKLNIQSNINNKTQRSIKREEIYLAHYMRQERLCYSEKPIISLESQVNEENSFFSQWLVKNQHIKRDFAAIANLAAQGIKDLRFSIAL